MSNGSSIPDDIRPDRAIDSDELIARIVEYDEALAAGRTLDVKQDETVRQLPGETQVRLFGIFDCLEFLDRVRRVRREPAADTSSLAEVAGRPPAESGGNGPLLSIGRFEVVRELGRGGHGVVFLANDPLLRRQVALKVPRPEFLLSASMGRRFVGEARAAAALDHPNILKVYEVGSDGAICYIAQELCTGPSLAEWLRDQVGKVDPGLAAEIVRELARGVEHAHQAGVLHRDLKPANVLLQPVRRQAGDSTVFDPEARLDRARRSQTRRELAEVSLPHERQAGSLPHEGQVGGLLRFVPKLADFGIAKVFDEESDRTATLTGTAIGTVAYMSPEQAAGKPKEIGPASDIYGLGAILYELLTGRPPFEVGSGAGVMETLRKVIAEEPTRPQALRSDLPADLEAICLKCLEKSPADRYATAGKLASDLERFLHGESVSVRPAGRMRRTARRLRRQPLSMQIGWAGVALLVGALVVCLAMIWAGRGPIVGQSPGPPPNPEAEYLDGIEHVAQGYFDAVANRGDVKTAVRELDAFLERHRPQPGKADYRGFEWHYLWRLCHPDQVAKQFPKLFDLVGHKGEVYYVTFSPDGKRIATAGQDHTGRIWDAANGKPIATLMGHTDDVNWISFFSQADDGPVLTASDDKTARIWDSETGKPQGVLSGHEGQVITVEVARSTHPDEPDQILTCDDHGQLRIWDWTTKRLVRVIPAHSGRIHALAPVRGRNWWVTASSDGTAKEWNSLTWTQVRTHVVDSTNAGDTPSICSVSCNTEGTLVALGSGKSERLFGHRQRGASGTQVLGPLPIDDLLTGTRWLTLVGPQGAKDSVRFYPGQCLLVSTSRGHLDSAPSSHVLLSDVPTQRYWTPCGTRHPACWCAAFSPDGTRFATAATDGIVRVWDSSTIPNGTRLEAQNHAIERAPSSLHYSRDGSRLLVTHGAWLSSVPGYRFAIWDVSGERPKVVLAEPTNGKLVESFAGCFSADGRFIAVDSTELTNKDDKPALASSRIRILEVGSLREGRRLEGYRGVAQKILISPDGKTILAVTGDTNREQPDKDRPQLNFWLRPQAIHADRCWDSTRAGDFLATSLSPDGKLLATNRDQVEIYDFPSLKLVAKLPVDLRNRGAICFSADGQLLAAGGDDGAIRLFQTRTGNLLKTLVADGHAVLSLAFSPDATRLAVGVDGAARVDLWHVPSGKRLTPLAMPTDLISVTDLSFSPDCRTLAAAGSVVHYRGGVFLFPLGRVGDAAGTVPRSELGARSPE